MSFLYNKSISFSNIISYIFLCASNVNSVLQIMEEAHVDAVMILGEMFGESAGEFDFGAQDTTKRIQQLVPTIITHRLCPPPEEIYSLHRKLSGVFLLASKLKVKMSCRDLFMDIYNEYKFG